MLGLVAEGDKADVDEAVKAARKAFEDVTVGLLPALRGSDVHFDD